MNEYLKSLVATFREANALNAPGERAENEARISRLEEAAGVVAPFLEKQ